MNYVYILMRFDNKSYIGCADDLKDRIDRHQKGFVPATKDRLPINLFPILRSQINIQHLNLKNISNPVQEELL